MSASRTIAKAPAATASKRKSPNGNAAATADRKAAEAARSTRAMLDQIQERGVALTARLSALLARMG